MSERESPAITVVIPVYNGEKFLDKTLSSLERQEFLNFEVVCVDDGSKDNSLSIVERYCARDKRFKLYKTKENQGSASRVVSYATKFINGDYFVYSSQDDFFSRDWLSSMHCRALESGADAVIPTLVFYDGRERADCKILSGIDGDKSRELSGLEAFSYALDWTIPGNALWKTWLVEKFGYFDFAMNADEYTARFYYLHCGKVVFSNGEFFYRKNNPDAITVKMSEGTFDLPRTDYLLWKLSKEAGVDAIIQRNALKRSIRGMLHYYPYTIFGSYSGARKRFSSLFYEMREDGAVAWLKERKKGFGFIEVAAVSSFESFVLLSFVLWGAKWLRRVGGHK